MPATAADLVGAIQPLTHLTERWLKTATLSLFESGLIEAGPAGRAALKRGPRDAAAIAVATLACPSAPQAGKYARGILTARRQRGAIIDPYEVRYSHELGGLADVALSRPSFWEAITVLIQEWKILEDGLRHFSALPNAASISGEWTSSMILSFTGLPFYSASIEFEVSEKQPLNEQGFTSGRHTFFSMDADWIGEATTELSSANLSEFMEAVPHLSGQEFDHTFLIALGRRLDA